ncbi:MAG TPA: flagellar hook protein FlgE [Gammaproteobacteria bacterium]|nr:flagellar hook protein FlgE [Gammaproteobacteria bacterium]
MTFEIALTGINAASAELEVISNNIANNATNGFKQSHAEFADVYAVSGQGTPGTAIGSGVRVSRVAQDFSQGDMTFTSNNLDIAISGEGFFRMDDHGSVVYSRAGNFGLDAQGNIVNSVGHSLTGYTANEDGVLTSSLGRLQLDTSDLPPRQTSEIALDLNLDPSADILAAPFDVNDPSTYNFSTSTMMFDSLGTSHEVTMYYHKDGDNTWSSFMFVEGQEVSAPGGDSLVFSTAGGLESVNGGTGNTISTIPFTPVGGTAEQTIDIDISSMTQFVNPFGINNIQQNGYSPGRLQDIDVDASGVIYGDYNNGEAKILGQIVLTSFSNEQGLTPIGDSAWKESVASGIGVTNAPGSADLGLLQSGAVEESNVDLTAELVAMIGAQRSFQANAQVISTADTLAQTIINLR